MQVSSCEQAMDYKRFESKLQIIASGSVSSEGKSNLILEPELSVWPDEMVNL
jgi:hypothetical protein